MPVWIASALLVKKEGGDIVQNVCTYCAAAATKQEAMGIAVAHWMERFPQHGIHAPDCGPMPDDMIRAAYAELQAKGQAK